MVGSRHQRQLADSERCAWGAILERAMGIERSQRITRKCLIKLQQ
jgi:hypothetical protein